MDISNEELLGKVEGMLSGLERTITQFTKELYGNGRPGVLSKVTELESKVTSNLNTIGEIKQTIETKAKEEKIALENMEKENSLALASINKKLDEIQDTFNKHIEDKEKHTVKGLLLHKGILQTFLLIYILLELVSRILIPVLTIEELQKVILKILGIPL